MKQPRAFRRPGRPGVLAARRPGAAIRAVVPGALAMACLSVAACSASPAVGPESVSGSPSQRPNATQASRPVPVASGSSSTLADPGAADAAERARKAIQASVEKSVGGEKSPSSDAVRLAIAATLPPGSTVEVSRSVTPTGLAADAVVGAAVVSPGRCAFVYLRDGAATTQLLPARPDGTCFVGDQR